MSLRIERIALGVLVGMLALFAVMAVVGCDSNVVYLPPPAESDPQFMIMRRYHSESAPDVWVIKDKVNGREFYVTHDGGMLPVEGCK